MLIFSNKHKKTHFRLITKRIEIPSRVACSILNEFILCLFIPRSLLFMVYIIKVNYAIKVSLLLVATKLCPLLRNLSTFQEGARDNLDHGLAPFWDAKQPLLTLRQPAFSFSGTFVRPFLFWSVTHARINSPSTYDAMHILVSNLDSKNKVLRNNVLCQFPVASLFSEVSSRQSEYHNFLLTAH